MASEAGPHDSGDFEELFWSFGYGSNMNVASVEENKKVKVKGTKGA